MKKFLALVALLFGGASVSRAGSIYDTTVLGNSPVAFFPLDESSGTTANNLANASENGTYNGGVTLGVPGGPDGSGAGFTPTGTSVGIPLYSALKVTTAFSIEAWIDVTTANESNLASIFAINRNTSGTGLALSVYQNQLTLGMNNSTVNYGETAQPQLPDGVWDQVALTWSSSVDGGAPQFYINGVLVANSDANTFTQSLSLGGATAANIGVEFANGDNGGRWFQGGIEDVSFYNTALTADQISTDYAASVPEPSSLGLTAGGLLLMFVSVRRYRRGIASRSTANLAQLRATQVQRQGTARFVMFSDLESSALLAQKMLI